MKRYKNIRAVFQNEILSGRCYCILSNLQITDPNLCSIEHYVPLARVSYHLATQRNNIFPAYRIINNLKGQLLPCEYENDKVEILQYALDHYKLRQVDKEIVKAAIKNSYTYNINPCKFCILHTWCENSR